MDILTYLDKLNWQAILGMFAICWYFTHDLKNELKSLNKDMKSQGERIDRLYQMFVDLLNKKRD